MEADVGNAREQWEKEQAARAAFDWFGTNRPAAEQLPRIEPPSDQPEKLSGDIARETNGEIVPRYELVGQRAEQLVSGDLLLEPRFGPVRITWIATRHDVPTADDRVQLRWIDSAGIQTAALVVAADTPVVLRVPDRRDARTIQWAIDRSRYFGTNLEHRSARLVAAHLQHSATSGLYRLAVLGQIVPSALEEIAVITGSRRPYIRRWSQALDAYCRARLYRGGRAPP